MVKKLSQEQLKRYIKAEDAKAMRLHVTVDEMHRKNLQAWIPYELWKTVKARVESEGTSMNKYVEQALAIYVLLEDEDVERIVVRHKEGG